MIVASHQMTKRGLRKGLLESLVPVILKMITRRDLFVRRQISAWQVLRVDCVGGYEIIASDNDLRDCLFSAGLGRAIERIEDQLQIEFRFGCSACEICETTGRVSQIAEAGVSQ